MEGTDQPMGAHKVLHVKRSVSLGFLLGALFLPSPADRVSCQERKPPSRKVLPPELKGLVRLQRGLQKTARRVRRATLTIENWKKNSKGVEVLRSGGSGVLISSKGHALTNQHVVAGADLLYAVFWNGFRSEAKVVGRDPRGDLVVIQVEKAPPGSRSYYARPDPGPARRVKPGALVFATGNPFFLAPDGDPVVSLGIVSGLGRVTGGTSVYGAAIQHDAPINPGNSGGPLWDLEGRLLGINGRISSSGATSPGSPSSTGVGYAIPLTQVSNFLSQLLKGAEAVVHADQVFGVKVRSARDAKGKEAGAQVTEVKPGSPAALARCSGFSGRGLRVGDRIVRIVYRGKSHEIRNARDYMNLMTTIPGGVTLTVVVKRGRTYRRFSRIKIPSSLNGRAGRKRGGR